MYDPDVTTESVQWKAQWQIEGYKGELIDGKIDGEIAVPYFTTIIPGNLCMYGGASCLWEYAIGNGTTVAGQTLTYLSNSRAYLGVGDSSTAAAATQTDLQAATNKLRVAMDAAYPTHSDGTTLGSASIIFRSTFGTSSANYAWNEVGLFNGSSGGRMINRKVVSEGTKTSADTWVLQLTIALA